MGNRTPSSNPVAAWKSHAGRASPGRSSSLGLSGCGRAGRDRWMSRGGFSHPPKTGV